MQEHEAREIAREVMRPAGLLLHLVGRGHWWPGEASLRGGKLEIGRVVAATYLWLNPVWSQYSQLDPGGERTDPLDLADGPAEAEDSPDDLFTALLQLRAAAKAVLPALLLGFPSDRERLVEGAEALDVAAEGATRFILGEKARL
jgi:hypothetical protein